MSLIKLPYLGNNTYGEINKSPRGYTEVKGVEKYQGAYTRNVRIVRVDLLSNLPEHFTLDTISKYRSVIYYIIAGYGSSDKRKLILESLKHIYSIDDVFKLKLGKLLYFRDSDLEGMSTYEALLRDVENCIPLARNTIIKEVPHVKAIVDSHLYIYFSVKDTMSEEILLQIKGMEVISK